MRLILPQIDVFVSLRCVEPFGGAPKPRWESPRELFSVMLPLRKAFYALEMSDIQSKEESCDALSYGPRSLPWR